MFTALLNALGMAFAMGWEILWPLVLGFALSAVIQAIVSHREMSRLLPDDSEERAFPALVTIPSSYDLAGARSWHFAFAWLLVVPGLLYWVWSFANRHIQRDLAPVRAELKPHSILEDIKDHVRLRFPKGGKARHYNILQKLSYLGVLFGLPLAMVL